jgi:hypothetical protein
MSQIARCVASSVPTTLLWIALAAHLNRLEPGTARWDRLLVLAFAGIVGWALYMFTARALRCREAEKVFGETVGRLVEAVGRIRPAKGFAS